MVVKVQLLFLDDHKIVKFGLFSVCFCMCIQRNMLFSSLLSSFFFWGEKECCEDICTNVHIRICICDTMKMTRNFEWNERNRELDFIKDMLLILVRYFNFRFHLCYSQ